MTTNDKGRRTVNCANHRNGGNIKRRRRPVKRHRRHLRKWVKVTMLLMVLLMALMMASSILRGCGSPKMVEVEVEAEPAHETEEVMVEPRRSDEEIQADIDTFLYYRDVVGLEDFDVVVSNQLMKELIENYRISLGGAAGMSGNAYDECRHNAGLIDEPEWYFEGTNLDFVHIGLFQWEASSRWPVLEEYMEHYRLDKHSMYGQLRAMFYSLDASDYQWLFQELRRGDIDSTYAAKLFQDYYEVAVGQNTEQRQNAAVMAAAAYRLYLDGIDASTL